MTQEGIAHLETLRADARDEIRQRIEQRDRYSIQMTLALGAILGVGFSSPDEHITSVLVAAPLVAIYFTVLILYSYRVHSLLARYLHEVVEPAVADACGTPRALEWEAFYSGHNVPGIRRTFFIWSLWVIVAGSPAYLWFVAQRPHPLTVALAFLTPIYVAAAAWITYRFGRS